MARGTAAQEDVDPIACYAYIRAVPQRIDDQKFLRAAIKTALRMQRCGSSDGGGPKSEGVATLQRIKASLRKRNSNSRRTRD